jgi:hypothetical protein
MKKPKPIKRYAVLYSDGSLNVSSGKRLQGKSSLEVTMEECAGGNENTRRKADRCQVVEVEVVMVRTILDQSGKLTNG